MTACDPIARESSIEPTRDMADQAYTNTMNLADEIDSLRKRVKELESAEAELRKQNIEDAKDIEEIGRAYNAHLENHSRTIP